MTLEADFKKQVEIQGELLPSSSTRCALDRLAYDIAGHPASVEVARLWLDEFSINVALPSRISIERYIALDIGKGGSWFVVTPSTAVNLIACWCFESEVVGDALPFAKGASRCRSHVQLD